MEKGVQSRCKEEEIVIYSTDETVSSREQKCNDKLKRIPIDVNNAHNLQTVLGYGWQGVSFKTIIEDESTMKGNFDWLCRWKSCPTSTVSEMMLLLFQTLDTKCYRKHLKTSGPRDNVNDTICRLCKQGQESVKHILSNCGVLVIMVYTKRHNDALTYFFLELLNKLGFVESVPPLFANIDVKPEYESDEYLVQWNVPEYSGRDNETLRDTRWKDSC